MSNGGSCSPHQKKKLACVLQRCQVLRISRSNYGNRPIATLLRQCPEMLRISTKTTNSFKISKQLSTERVTTSKIHASRIQIFQLVNDKGRGQRADANPGESKGMKRHITAFICLFADCNRYPPP